MFEVVQLYVDIRRPRFKLLFDEYPVWSVRTGTSCEVPNGNEVLGFLRMEIKLELGSWFVKLEPGFFWFFRTGTRISEQKD
jgi:hypothetical protein